MHRDWLGRDACNLVLDSLNEPLTGGSAAGTPALKQQQRRIYFSRRSTSTKASPDGNLIRFTGREQQPTDVLRNMQDGRPAVPLTTIFKNHSSLAAGYV